MEQDYNILEPLDLSDFMCEYFRPGDKDTIVVYAHWLQETLRNYRAVKTMTEDYATTLSEAHSKIESLQRQVERLTPCEPAYVVPRRILNVKG